MAMRQMHACLDCGQLILTGSRCRFHASQHEKQRVAKRGSLYGRAHRKAARAAIEDEGWCHWPGCYRTADLTADHVIPGDPDSPLRVLCRSHNSERANRMRMGR